MHLDRAAFEGGGYRLPTEAEWEYVCRAGTATSRYLGNSWFILRECARLTSTTSLEQDGPIPCGSLLPNDFGLFDMLGNLAEWCQDADYDYLDFTKDRSVDFQFKDVVASDWYVVRGDLHEQAARSPLGIPNQV